MALINTRQDLDSLIGTPEYGQFMTYLKGTMTKKVDTAVYPVGYGQPGYTGPTVTPVWSTVQDLSVIERFGFSPADFTNY